MKILVPNIDGISPFVTAMLTRAKKMSGVPSDIVMIDNPNEENIDITLGTVKGYKGKAFKTLSPKEVTNHPQALIFLSQAMRYVYLGQIEPDIDWIIWQGQNIEFNHKSIVALDIETAGDIEEDTFAEGRILSIALWNGYFGVVIPEELAETPEAAKLIQRLCDTCTIICHNGTFDMPYLSKRLGIDVYHHEDTLLMHFVLDNLAKEHGLKPLAQRWLRASDWDSEAKKYLKGGAYFENIPRDLLYQYNIMDAYWTHELYRFFLPTLKATGKYDYYRYRMDVSKVLHDVQMNGVAVSLSALDELEEEYQHQCDKALSVLQLLAGEGFNPQSPKQIKEYFASKGVSSPSFDSDHLKKLRNQCNEREFIDALLEYRYASKVIGAFIANIRKKVGQDGRIHPNYLPHGAKTGRLSAKNPAIQTMGRDSGIKRALVAEPGNKIISCDYSQAELRTVAELADDDAMIKAFAPDAPDFFDDLMTKVYSEKFPTIDKYHDFKHEHPKDAKNKRALIKSIVYGCVPIDRPILTKRGWLTYDELMPGVDETWGVNPETYEQGWVKVTNKGRYDSAKIMRITCDKGLVMTCTPNHKWLNMFGELVETQSLTKNVLLEIRPSIDLGCVDRVESEQFIVSVERGFESDVWCPTTEWGTWTTLDDNGNAVLTGNSNYGRGVPAIATALEQPVEQAQHVYDQYMGAYPGLRDWQKRVRHSVGRKEEDHERKTKFGLTYDPLYVSGKNYSSTQNEALAFVPQSTANDICLHAAIEVNEKVRQYGAKIVGLVHDAIYVECPEEHVEACSRMMEQEMSKAATIVFNRVSFVAEAEVGDNWEEV
nr:MAG TPA: DNA POLYMERASE [Caudoviricetes sp.]